MNLLLFSLSPSVPLGGSIWYAMILQQELRTLLPRRTLTSQVIDYVVQLIKSGKARPGDKLPTEKQLTAALGVSRTCVREAMKSLESLRLIRIRPRVGAVVLEPSPTALLNAEQFCAAVEDHHADVLMEFRKIIEIGVASLAAEKADDNDILAIKRALDDYRRQVEADEADCATDMAFHAAVVAASKNPMALMVWEMITPRLHEILERNMGLPNVGRDTLRDHVKIFQAIKARNPSKARAAMRAHLNYAERIWLIAKTGDARRAMSKEDVVMQTREETPSGFKGALEG